jgi:hypothetical protein
METKQTKRNRLRAQLFKIESNIPLQEFLDRASAVSDDMSAALDGIYCGREGEVRCEPVGDYAFITFGWYTTFQTPRVEFCYISWIWT